MKRILPLIVICFATNCCQQLDRGRVSDLSEAVGFELNKLKSDYLIILPGQGCSGCLQKARQFMMDNYENDKFKFLLTKFDSKKQLKIMYGSKVIEKVILDNKDLFYEGGFNSMYPAIIKLTNGSFKIRLADPDSYSLWNEIL